MWSVCSPIAPSACVLLGATESYALEVPCEESIACIYYAKDFCYTTLVADPSADETARAEAIERLADGLAEFWKPRGAVEYAIQDSGEDRTALKRRAVQIGLIQASLAGRDRQEMRFSDIGWLKDREGRKVAATPETEIGWLHYTVWLRQNTLRLAGEWVVEEFGEPGIILAGPEGKAIEIEVDSGRVHDDEGSPMPLLDDASPAVTSLLKLIEDVATPRQQEIVDRLLELDWDKSRVAEALGISHQNINEQLKRLRAGVMSEQ